MRSLLRVAVGVALTLPAPARLTAQEPIRGLDAYVAKAMAEWKVPGLSIAIVRNDSVLVAKGFGIRQLGRPDPIDEHTLFEIGSATKPFTATLVAMLATDGKLKLDDRISEHLPGFRMYDAYANSEVTLRDALSHRTGLSRGELMWLGAGISRDDVIHRVRFQPPSTSFRSIWAYNNVMFLVAGQAAARAAGSTWDDLVQRRILAPLGMTESRPVIRDYGPYPNAATPHAGVGRDSVIVKRHLNLDATAPAGAIVSNARDMAQWLRFQLGNGGFGGQRLVSASALQETHTAQMAIANPPLIIPGPATDWLTKFHTYGLGWFIEDYRGHPYWNHGGNTDGMTAAQGMLPDRGLGVVILSNLNQSPVPLILTRWIFDRELGVCRSEIGVGRFSGRRIAAAGNPLLAPVAASSAPPPLPVSSYVGTFADSLYGEATVSVQDGRLYLTRGEWTGPLESVSGDNFIWTVVPASLIPRLPVKFDIGANGAVQALSLGIFGDSRSLGRKVGSGRN